MNALNTPARNLNTATLLNKTATTTQRIDSLNPDDQARLILAAYERFFVTIWKSSGEKTNPTGAASQASPRAKATPGRKRVTSSRRVIRQQPSFASSAHSGIMV
jgi:hypothetical protein